VIDQDPADPLDFSIEDYASQLVDARIALSTKRRLTPAVPRLI
jgi:hypothetical protein